MSVPDASILNLAVSPSLTVTSSGIEVILNLSISSIDATLVSTVSLNLSVRVHLYLVPVGVADDARNVYVLLLASAMLLHSVVSGY